MGTNRGHGLANWTPKQEQQQGDAVDLRCLSFQNPKGYKESKKRRLQPDTESTEAVMDLDTDAATAPSKRLKLENGHPYRVVSGKVWKSPGERASTLRPSKTGAKSWDEKMASKAAKKVFQEQKASALQARKDVRKAAAAKKAAALERKKANQEKSAIVQKISNAATVKKMMKSKKQRKLLKTADTT